MPNRKPDPPILPYVGPGGQEKRGGLIADVAVHTDGSIYAAGYAENLDPGSAADIWFARFSASGDLVFGRFHSGDAHPGASDDARSLVVRSDGSVVVVGSENDGSVFIRAFSSNGQPSWTAAHEGERAMAAVRVEDDHVVIGGNSDTGPWIAEFNVDGEEVWSATELVGPMSSVHDLAIGLHNALYMVGRGVQTTVNHRNERRPRLPRTDTGCKKPAAIPTIADLRPGDPTRGANNRQPSRRCEPRRSRTGTRMPISRSLRRALELLGFLSVLALADISPRHHSLLRYARGAREPRH